MTADRIELRWLSLIQRLNPATWRWGAMRWTMMAREYRRAGDRQMAAHSLNRAAWCRKQ